MDTWVLCRKGSKTPTEEHTKTKGGAVSEGKTNQRLIHPGIHPMCSYKTHRLLWMPTSAGCPEQDLAITWEALLLHDKYWEGHSHPAIKLSIESPNGELEKGPKELKAFAGPQEEQQWVPQYSQSSQGLNHQPNCTHAVTHGSKLIGSREMFLLNTKGRRDPWFWKDWWLM